MLPAQTFPRNAVCKRFFVLTSGLAEVTHKETDVGAEAFVRLSSQISDHPLRVERVFRRHAEPHDGVVESLPLARVEPEDLDVAADSGQKWRQRSVSV